MLVERFALGIGVDSPQFPQVHLGDEDYERIARPVPSQVVLGGNGGRPKDIEN